MTKVQEREEEKSRVREIGRTNSLKQKEQMDSITPLPVKVLNKNPENIGEIKYASFPLFLFRIFSNEITTQVQTKQNYSEKPLVQKSSC